VYTAAVILPAAGSGSRMRSDLPKPFIEVGGRPVLWHTLTVFAAVQEIKQIIVAVNEEYLSLAGEIARQVVTECSIEVIAGGKERLDSVYAGVMRAGNTDLVVVHDAVRPFVTAGEIKSCMDRAFSDGAAILAVPARDTVKEVQDGVITGTPDRKRIWLAQTPQAFRRAVFLKACEKAVRSGLHFTDDAAMVEYNGEQVYVVEGNPGNIKITYPNDLEIAETMIGNSKTSEFRTGFGYDVHQLGEGRRLILGGVKIDYHIGLVGHSDADVLLHAIIDALLGAAALGDLGHFYPDTDRDFKDIDSRLLLRDAYEKVRGMGYSIVNIDATIVAEKPKMAPHIPQMKKHIASDLLIDIDQISIKATTSEKIGFIGREEGMSAMATVTLRR
jgi:2-C-methyl-D-erythritol 4-phosphate cytidylyltransferase / 2-C-methyl-D-erythritol 2,4-cyclodiphosphate synthase